MGRYLIDWVTHKGAATISGPRHALDKRTVQWEWRQQSRCSLLSSLGPGRTQQPEAAQGDCSGARQPRPIILGLQRSRCSTKDTCEPRMGKVQSRTGKYIQNLIAFAQWVLTGTQVRRKVIVMERVNQIFVLLRSTVKSSTK